MPLSNEDPVSVDHSILSIAKDTESPISVQGTQDDSEPSPKGLGTAEKDIDWSTFRSGGTNEDGEPISRIVHKTDRCIVYITGNGILRYHLDDKAVFEPNTSIAAASELYNQLETCDLPVRVHRRAVFVIGLGLARAFEESSAGKAGNFFVDAANYITANRRETLHITYYLCAVLVGILLAGVAVAGTTTLPQHWEFWLGCGLGAAGAVVSVTLRFNSIPVEAYASARYTSLGGISRSVFGAASGLLFVLLYKAKLVLGGADPYMLAIACFVSGFSERLVPELLAIVESNLRSSLAKHRGDASAGGPRGSSKSRGARLTVAKAARLRSSSNRE